MRRLRFWVTLVILMLAVPFLMAQVGTFPRYRLGGGTSGKVAEVDSSGNLLMVLNGTAAAQGSGDPGYLSFPRYRLAGGATGNLAEVDSSGQLLVSINGGSPSLTSLTLTGTTGNCLTVDSPTLIADCANHRVGIGTATPLAVAHIHTGTDQDLYIRTGTTDGGSAGIALTSVNDASNAYKPLVLAGNPVTINAAGGTGSVNFFTTGTTYSLGLGGNVARTMGLERHTTSNTAGNTYTISGGGATTGATDKNGGNLILQPGLATGTGTGQILLQTPTPGSTGTADTTQATRAAVDSTGVAVTGNVNASAGYQVGSLPLYQGCTLVIGTDNGSALADADLGPQGRQCFVANASTLVEITVAADGGTPNVIPRRNRAGTGANFVSSALATAAAGGLACSKTGATTGLDGATTCSATLQNTALNAGDWIELISGTAGGVAKRMSIRLTWSTP